MTKIIMLDSPEAAQYRTFMSGWVSRSGLFFGDGPQAEDMARYDGCTHIACRACGAPTPKGWTACRECRNRLEVERYKAMPRKKWDGESMLYSQARDEFFSDPDQAEESLEGGETLNVLRLIICEPNHGRHIDEDYFCDELTEDGELPDCLNDAINAFNEAIDKAPPLSWSPGSFALELPPLKPED